MTPRISLRPVLAVSASVAVVLGMAATGAGAAYAARTARHAATPLPSHVFNPYFEAYTSTNPVTEAKKSGSRYETFAFIQTATAGSCTAYWNGSTSQPLTQATFGSDISQIQAMGGNVTPSFGGYTADTTGTDIADSCTSVSSIAKVYEGVITTYNVPRIDLDIEQNSLTNTAGYERRNSAVAMVEAWAKQNGRNVQFSYTIPSTTTGPDAQEDLILQNAVSHGVKFTLNMMTFDYYTGGSHEMAQATETAGQGAFNELKSLYPSDSSSQIWAMIGVTEMVGIDDYGAPETFTKADASTVLSWAKSKGIDMISFWALQRDNGGCPGTSGAGACSGIAQGVWYFSHVFEHYTN